MSASGRRYEMALALAIRNDGIKLLRNTKAYDDCTLSYCKLVYRHEMDEKPPSSVYDMICPYIGRLLVEQRVRHEAISARNDA